MSTTLQPFLEAIRGDWQSRLRNDEWYFTRVVDSIASRASAEDAYEPAGALSQVLVGLRDETLVWAAGTLLLTLARRSDTTKMPPELAARWAAINASLYPDLAAQLARCYRQEVPGKSDGALP